MKTNKELVKILKDNFTNERGQIELNGLDLNVDLLIKNCNIKNYRSHSNKVEGYYYSHFNEIKGYYYSHCNEIKGYYDSSSNKVEGNYRSYSNEIKGYYYSHCNEIKGYYDSNSNKVENNQYYPEYAIIKGKEYQVDLTDNYYLIIEKSTTKNGVTIIKGFDRNDTKTWLYKNSFVGYHASTKERAKEGFKRKLKGFEKNIELIETIKECGKITREDYHNLTGACDLGISAFAERIGKPDRDYLTLEELETHLRSNDYGYNMIMKWLKEE